MSSPHTEPGYCALSGFAAAGRCKSKVCATECWYKTHRYHPLAVTEEAPTEANPAENAGIRADAEALPLWQAFIAGFRVSGEGFNGEYPFQDHDENPALNETVMASFSEWLASADIGRSLPDSAPVSAASKTREPPTSSKPEGSGAMPNAAAAGETPDSAASGLLGVGVAARLLDRADDLIMEDTGSVVCWHEYTDDETLRSDCVQCCVEHARSALGRVGVGEEGASAAPGKPSGAPDGATGTPSYFVQHDPDEDEYDGDWDIRESPNRGDGVLSHSLARSWSESWARRIADALNLATADSVPSAESASGASSPGKTPAGVEAIRTAIFDSSGAPGIDVRARALDALDALLAERRESDEALEELGDELRASHLERKRAVAERDEARAANDAARETLRQKFCSPDIAVTETRDSYADGYVSGLIEAVRVLDAALAAASPEGEQEPPAAGGGG